MWQERSNEAKRLQERADAEADSHRRGHALDRYIAWLLEAAPTLKGIVHHFERCAEGAKRGQVQGQAGQNAAIFAFDEKSDAAKLVAQLAEAERHFDATANARMGHHRVTDLLEDLCEHDEFPSLLRRHGVKWRRTTTRPPEGRELGGDESEALARALLSKTDFAPDEWGPVQVRNLEPRHYVVLATERGARRDSGPPSPHHEAPHSSLRASAGHTYFSPTLKGDERELRGVDSYRELQRAHIMRAPRDATHPRSTCSLGATPRVAEVGRAWMA